MDSQTILATVQGANAPYSVLWESDTIHIGSTVTLTASDFLNDISLLQPTIVQHFEGLVDSIVFQVTISDDVGNICSDSVLVRFSSFVELTAECLTEIFIGDTTTLYSNLIGGIPPLTYTWYPSYNMSDSTSHTPMVWPTQDTLYYVNVWDAIGCGQDSTTVCRVDVLPVGIGEVNDVDAFNVFPNPCQSQLNIVSGQTVSRIDVFDVEGQSVLTYSDLEVSSVQLNVSNLNDGIYVARVLNAHGQTRHLTFFKSSL
jgi:hypothetical protein